MMDFKPLSDNVRHSHAGIEAGVGILVNDLYISGKGQPVFSGKMGDLSAVKADRASGRLIETY